MNVPMIKVAPEIYTPLDNVLGAICREAGLPDSLQYYYIDEEGNLAHDITVYHNRVEKEIVAKVDSDKIEIAKAIKTIYSYMHGKNR